MTSIRGPQAQDEKTPTTKHLSLSSDTNNGDRIHSWGPQGVDSSKAAAEELAQTITNAKLGDKNAQVTLGDMYKDGWKIKQDYQAALVPHGRRTGRCNRLAEGRSSLSLWPWYLSEL